MASSSFTASLTLTGLPKVFDNMDQSPEFLDKGTRFTNYSSIHSADAFVGNYQVMYTPGSSSPQQSKHNKKSTRFSRTVSGNPRAQQNLSQSYLLPTILPNTSQIMPDQGALPHLQVHYGIPADEKQIVASLRALQRDLAEAMQTITNLTRERDDAVHELRLLRAGAGKTSSPVTKRYNRNIEEELFDLSSPIQDSQERPKPSQPHSRKEAKEQKETQVSDEARIISQPPIRGSVVVNRREPSKSARDQSKSYQRPMADDTEPSMFDENPTAASNTSRRRRRASVDENMTSAYILPDITMDQQVQDPVQVSKAAQNVLHSLDPEHINNCDVCTRLTRHIKATARRTSGKTTDSRPKIQDFAQVAVQNPDYTAAIAGFADDSHIGDATMRPKVSPAQALMRVKVLMDAQFRKAKERHRLAWEKYDRIEAPSSSRKHAEVSKEMQHWAEKMEECRVHLDYLRDVEEGMQGDE